MWTQQNLPKSLGERQERAAERESDKGKGENVNVDLKNLAEFSEKVQV